MTLFSSLFSSFHRISFQPADPLDNGLREEIEAERLEPEAIVLEDGANAQELAESWQSITTDLEKDPEWFKFTEE